jgi:hypothetical protein
MKESWEELWEEIKEEAKEVAREFYLGMMAVVVMAVICIGAIYLIKGGW